MAKPLACAPALVMFLLVALTACSSSTRRVDPTYDFAAIETFAWKEPPRLAAEGPGEELLRGLTHAVERTLEKRGVTAIEKQQADVVVSATLTVTTEIYELDPNFTQFEAEEVEQGVLTIEVFDRINRRSVWVGEQRRDLRVLRRAFGGLTRTWSEVSEPRQWHIERLVAAVLDDLPG